jgi:signal transduction histidine kinase
MYADASAVVVVMVVTVVVVVVVTVTMMLHVHDEEYLKMAATTKPHLQPRTDATERKQIRASSDHDAVSVQSSLAF